MKKIAALPVMLVLGLSVAACGKHDEPANLTADNVVLNDETGSDNLTVADDLSGNLADANATDGVVANAQ